jgi:hypothetical protein
VPKTLHNTPSFGKQQFRQRRSERERVGGPALAVGEGELLGFDHDVDGVSRQKTHRGEIEVLEDLQFLEQHEAGRIGRCLKDREAAVVDRDRLLNFGREGCQIGGRDQDARALQTRRKTPRQLPTVEGFGTLRGRASYQLPTVVNGGCWHRRDDNVRSSLPRQ